DFGGQFKNLAEAKERLMIAVPVALLLIFLLLHFTFGSVKYALLIFSAVPFSIIGGILALWLRGMPFSISAGVGFIALSGVAVLNGIVLIGMFNQLKNAGETNLKTIIRQGAGERIRPILLTAAVASLGFLPMAISHSPGSEVQKPLATVVIGGLISATLLTLFLLPVLYMLFEKFSMKRTLTKPLMVLLLLGFAGNKASSQTQPVLGLEEAIGLALQHHPAIKQSNFTLQARKAHEKAAFDPGHFSASLMGGQYNSLYSDKNFTLSQTFPFPLTSVLQARFYKSETKEATLSQQQTQKNTVLEVSAVWYELRNALQKKVLLDQENEQFKKAEQVARLRLSSGETNRLEILSVQTAGAELFTEISTLEQQIHSLSNSLQLLTGLSTAPQVSINEADARRDMPVLAEPDRVTSALPYQITMQKQQSALLLNRLEKSRFLPDISAGYFNQSLTGYHNFNGVEQFFNQQKRFTGYQVGLSFPLIFNAQQARAKSALLLSDAATEEASAMALTLKNQQQKLRSEMLSAIKNAEYLEANILPDAEAALKAAQTAWVAGESGYLEMIFLLRQVFQLRLSHLDEINRYNMAILQYEFLFK
ncbi:MAG: CusA/CzcA family heavy metal efflux RND transporter, partial [Bacteroidia bacterium]|nr:CusA/CzcA family heavy metal efflux RND transporter [Bacteroidia bacterium]